MTNEERKKLYAALAAPFPEDAIQRTSASVTGRGYDTTGSFTNALKKAAAMLGCPHRAARGGTGEKPPSRSAPRSGRCT